MKMIGERLKELRESAGYSPAEFALMFGINGELGAGRKMAGEVAFTVDEDESAWEFVFEPQVFGFGQAIYDIVANDIK